MNPSPPVTPAEAAPAKRPIRNLRWYICGLLFFATTVNYLDRQVLGILKPTLTAELGWNEAAFGWVVFAFQGAYALMMPLAGRLIDWLGTRIGYVCAVLVWSIASMSHAFARSAWQFALARFGLGLGEAGNFPAAIKTVTDWFPRSERALATGIFNSGSNLGAIAAPLLVAFCATHFGWRSTFFFTGSLDFLWIVAWLLLFQLPRNHPRLAPAELALIESGRDTVEETRVPYLQLLRRRAAWAFLLGKFLTDPVWWFYLYWLPGYLNKTYHLDLIHVGPPLITIYLLADVGSIGGGWISAPLIKRGVSVTRARKTALLACALCVLPLIGMQYFLHNMWLTVALIGLAAAAHQGWSANIYTLVSDTFPRSVVGSVVGLGGSGGAIGGMLFSLVVGYWLDFSHGAYSPLFFIAGLAYVTAFVVIHLLVPRIEQDAA
jgi:ACS family hexuronate transporter-like MFS transporter